MQRELEPYHHAWLLAHPERTPEWLLRMLAEGFQIHHMDGNHSNDDPKNLVLIEGGDHMMIHNGVARLLWRPPVKMGGGRPKKVKPTIEEMRQQLADAEEKEAKKAAVARKKALRDSGREALARNRARAQYEADLAKAAAMNMAA